MSRLIFLFVLVAITQSVKPPSSFKRCNRKQPDFNDCVLEAARDAVPQLVAPFKEVDLPSLKPLKIPSVTIKSGGQVVKVDQYFKDCELWGLEDVKIDKFEFDFDGKKVVVNGVFPKITLKGHYTMNGKVLLLPIVGKGPGTVILDDLKTDITLAYEKVKKDGLTYFKFVSSKLDLEPSLMFFNLENLFNGDKQLGDNINKVLNDNWKDVFADIKADYIELVNQIVLGLLEKFFDKVSIEEAFD